MRNWWALLVATAGAIVLAIVATTPPAPVSADAPVERFASGRAMADVRAIARTPHPTGSVANARVRDHLVRRLAGMGLRVRMAPFRIDAKGSATLRTWRGRAADKVDAANIVATLPGGDPARPAVLLMAHYDSVWASPGAPDDAAGVAAILEVVRAVRGAPRQRDLLVLLTDGEELGLQGARAFFRNDPAARRVGTVVNLEARGGGGRASMFETGARNGGGIALFRRAVARPVGTSLSVFVYRYLPNSTDFTPAKAASRPGYNFAFIGRPGLYHSPLATPAALDEGSVQDMGGQVLDLTRALLGARDLPARTADVTFFDVFGLGMIAYPATWGWAVLIAAGLLYGAGVRRWRWQDAATGAAAMVALLIGGSVLLYLANLLSGAGGAVNYYDRLAAIPRLQVQALLICLAMLLVGGRLATRAGEGGSVAAGAALPVAVLGIAAQILAPTAAFPVSWALLLGGLVAAAGRWPMSPTARAVAVIAAAVGAGYLLGFGFFLMQAVGPGLPIVAVVPLALVALLVWPLVPPMRGRSVATATALLLAGAAGTAIWVRVDAVAASVPPYSRFT